MNRYAVLRTIAQALVFSKALPSDIRGARQRCNVGSWQICYAIKHIVRFLFYRLYLGQMSFYYGKLRCTYIHLLTAPFTHHQFHELLLTLCTTPCTLCYKKTHNGFPGAPESAAFRISGLPFVPHTMPNSLFSSLITSRQTPLF